MRNQLLGVACASLIGYILARCWMLFILTPIYAPHEETKTVEFLIAQILLFISFSVGLYFFIQGVWQKDQTKKKMVYGFAFPVIFTVCSLSVFIPHEAEQVFLPIFIFSLFLSCFGIIFIFSLFDLDEENREEGPFPVKQMTERTVLRFHANPSLMAQIGKVTTAIQEMKQVHPLDVAVVHEVEKMEEQLLKCQEALMLITPKHQEKAEKNVHDITEKMLLDLDTYLAVHINQQDEEHLHALEKIRLLRNI